MVTQGEYKWCEYCTNAYVDKELDSEHDLSICPVGESQHGLRIMFRTGGNKRTKIEIEAVTRHGWVLVGYFTPKYCPFCGRFLYENSGLKL